MERIPVFTKQAGLFQALQLLIPTELEDECQLFRLEDTNETIDYLNIEIPNVIIIDFTGGAEQSQALLHTLRSDPWLFACGIVVIYESPNFYQDNPGILKANLIVGLPMTQVRAFFPNVLKILSENRQFLFQRVIGQDLASPISGTFFIENHPFAGSCYGNLIVNFLYNLHRIDDEGKFTLSLILQELLINAIEHGNCGITKEEKTEWLEGGGDMLDLIGKRLRDPIIASRMVSFEYQIRSDCSLFQITDQGRGFDWRKHLDCDPFENMGRHGRGLFLARSSFPGLSFNDAGNQVSFRVEHQQERANTAPALFSAQESVNYEPGDIIFSQGESSDHLFYIMKGTFAVEVNGKRMATLQRDDLFLGEMSFLLKNHRTATVRAMTEGCLARISKKDFVEAIREKPQYALFLCRLLAQRIERLNIRLS